MITMTTDRFENQFWRNEAGRLHREDGPAYIDANGTQAWFINGVRHRLDGPAFIWADGTQAWWLNGFGITDQVEAWIKENNFPDYTKWTDTQKIIFRLAFSGNAS